MLADPQTVTVNSVAQTLARVAMADGVKPSVFQKTDETYKLSVSHQKTGSGTKTKIRTLARIDFRAVVADPLSSANDYETLTVFTVIERPLVAFSAQQVKDLTAGFQAWLNGTMVDKLYGQES